jgi:hypothetical protein
MAYFKSLIAVQSYEVSKTFHGSIQYSCKLHIRSDAMFDWLSMGFKSLPSQTPALVSDFENSYCVCVCVCVCVYEGVSESFRTGRLERDLQMV